MLEVHGVGSQVTVGGHEARVTGVTIRDGGNVRYEVVWWAGAVRYCEWVEACEVTGGPAAKTRIGFGANGVNPQHTNNSRHIRG